MNELVTMTIINDGHDLIAVFKALSNGARLQILQWLKEPEKNFPLQDAADVHKLGVCVTLIQSKIGLSQSTVSQYLAELQKANLVQSTRQGQWTYYKRNEKGIADLADRIKHSL